MTEKDKADLIMHPVRLRIIEALIGTGGVRLTAGQIGERLGDVPPATLYRHINRLLAGGLIQVVEERPVRGVTEKVYALGQLEAYYGSSTIDQFTDADHSRYFMAYVAGLAADFQRYLKQPGHDLVADGVGFHMVPLYLTDAEFAELSRGLNEAIRGPLTNLPSPERRRRSLYVVSIPDPPAEPAAEPAAPPAPGKKSQRLPVEERDHD